MKSYIVFFSIISFFSAAVGFGFEGDIPQLFRVVFMISLMVVAVMIITSVVSNKLKHSREIKVERSTIKNSNDQSAKV